MAWVEMLETHRYTAVNDRRRTTKFLEGKRYRVTHTVRNVLVDQRCVAFDVPAPPRPPRKPAA